MSTQLEQARRGIVTLAMEKAARQEEVDPKLVRQEVAKGHAVIAANPAHVNLKPSVVGRAFRTKVNANIGRSAMRSCREDELSKMRTAISAGADFVMDLSVGPDLSSLRKAMLEACTVPLGTVPIYEAAWHVNGDVAKLDPDFLLSIIKKQAEEGVDFMTLHAGLLRDHIGPALKRTMGIVSRGGAMIAEWMLQHKKENPLFAGWDDVMDICARHDVTVSLGDGLRPGCLADASDEAQFAELDVLGMLVKKCRARGVQVMVEGPGHIPFNEIQMNMEREQKVCDHAPFYVLGPVVTDVAPGYDHITSCIGATAAAYYGASLLCYVTPAEHLGLPEDDDVKEGVIAYRIAAHAADVALKIPGARKWDDAMAQARKEFEWETQFELAMDGETARKKHEQTRVTDGSKQDYCSMCGQEFCSMRTMKRVEEKAEKCGQEAMSSK
ncbi:phosphomethylpyrimidine synthase ThiC [Verrucomicrobiota bacterium]